MPALSILKSLSLIGASLMCICFLNGCIFPLEPAPTAFKDTKRFASGAEWYLTYPRRDLENLSRKAKGKNVIFVAADQNIQFQFKERISEIYGREERLETLAWWEYEPLLSEIYDEIIRIPPEAVGFDVLEDAMKFMERRGKPFDMVLLTHGMPKMLSTGEWSYFLSEKELGEMKGQLPHLHLVYMQACFSSSLARSWLDAGAKTVLSFPDLNRNFFFFDFFLRRYRFESVQEARNGTIANLEFNLRNSLLHSQLLRALGTTPEQYSRATKPPEIFTK